MLKKALLAATMLVAASASQAGIILSEGFDDIDSLAAGGWSLINNSAPTGVTGWFQGNLFDAQAGAADSFIAANFLNAGDGGVISNWLLSPTLTLGHDTTLTFYTRTAGGAPFADQLEVRFSASGDSTDVGGSAGSVGDFGSLVLTINGSLGGDYPSEWTQYMVTFSGLVEDVMGRIAFRYFVPDTSIAGNYIGIDSLQVSVPEPSTFVLLLGALLPLILTTRRRRQVGKVALGIGLAASTGIAAASEPATQSATPAPSGLMHFEHVRVIDAPGTAPKPAEDQSAGMRAYIDPVTKQIRPQTQEEALQAAATIQTRTTARAASSASTLQGPGNAVGQLLGEESMVYAVAHKSSQGETKWDCETGADTADEAVSKAASSKVAASDER